MSEASDTSGNVTVSEASVNDLLVSGFVDTVPRVPTLQPEDLVGASEIAKRLGVHRDTIHTWRRRHDGFPAPIAELEQVLVWSWPDVERWARSTGRLS